VPVEVVQFGWQAQATYIRTLGAETALRVRQDGEPFLTDQGNFLLDCQFGPIEDPVGLASQLDRRAGIIGHGLFLGLATDVVVAGAHGVRHLVRPEEE
jgi:ribose 5-phosphate isomerase A